MQNPKKLLIVLILAFFTPFFGGIVQAKHSFSITDSLLADRLYEKAMELRDEGYYKQSLEKFEKASQIFEETKQWAKLAETLNYMGDVYS